LQPPHAAAVVLKPHFVVGTSPGL